MSKVRKFDVSGPEEAGAEMREAISPNGGMTPNDTLVSAMIHLGQSYNEGLSALSQEVLDFSRTRVSRDAVAAQSLARCKDWGEAVKIQQAWMQAATEEYMAQMGRLFQLAVKVTTDSYRPLQNKAEATWSANAS